jgi:hypothetical protein
MIARPLIGAGLRSGAMALWMIYDSMIGKVREREKYLDKIAWCDERVLDVGCGLGLFLIGAAKRLSTGRAVGIDKWQAEDLSGNNAAGTLNNAMVEGVADKVEVQTGDARSCRSTTRASMSSSRAWRCTISTTPASGRPPCAKSRGCSSRAGAC